MDFSTKQIARNRIQTLFEQAGTARKINPELSKRYIATARKIAMAAKIRLPLTYKRQICKKCNSLLVPGDCRVRIRQKREPHLIITCLECGFKTRIPLGKKKERNKIEQNTNQDETSR